MDVILGFIVALIIASSVDRYLYPEDYRVPQVQASRRLRQRCLARGRGMSRPAARQTTAAAAHRSSFGQASPWLTGDLSGRLTARQ